MSKVLMVGSAEQSGGGVASVLRSIAYTFLGEVSLRMAWYADTEGIWCEAVVCIEGLFQGAVYDMAV